MPLKFYHDSSTGRIGNYMHWLSVDFEDGKYSVACEFAKITTLMEMY